MQCVEIQTNKDSIIKLLILKWKSLLANLDYRKCLFFRKVYFGPYMAARQGDSSRHYFMQKIIENELKKMPRENFKMLEIGSWVGGSTITWAEAIRKFNSKGEIYCLDPWENYKNSPYVMSEALKKNKVFNLFQHNINVSGYGDMVFILRGFSDKILPILQHRQFDLIFIDGDHSYEAVSKDLQNASPLLREGGVLCGDDLELQSSEIDIKNGIKNREQEWITDPKAKRGFHPGVCLAVGDFFEKEVSVWRGFWAMRKKANEWKKIKLDVDTKNIRIPQHLKL